MPAPSSEAGARIAIESGDLAGSELRLAADETLLGRGPAADVSLPDENVSREHALILRDASSGVWTIEDLQSTNGTLVNGRRCRSQALASGDAIRVGRTELRFWIDRRADFPRD